jgi:hypothetical protein
MRSYNFYTNARFGACKSCRKKTIFIVYYRFANRLLYDQNPVSIALLFLLITVSAQEPVFKWAKPFHGNNVSNYRDYSNGRTVGVDKDGNFYSAG